MLTRMNCPKCQFQINVRDVFCSNCGFKLSEEIPIKSEVTGYAPIMYQGKSDHLIIDEFSTFIYAVSFFLCPVGIWVWAFYRKDKPISTTKILVITFLGFLFWTVLLSSL